MIELSERQWQAMKNGEAIRVSAAEIGEDIVLLRATLFETIRELVEDQQEQRVVLAHAMIQAREIAQENPY